MDNNDELLDIVNELDQIVGQKYRSEIWIEKLNNFRVINVFLVNDNKEIWIPRRSSNKKIFPLCLDASAGGHVAAGENYDQAFQRELREELNIELADVEYKFLMKLTPISHNVSAYMHLYIINTNISPKFSALQLLEQMFFFEYRLKGKGYAAT